MAFLKKKKYKFQVEIKLEELTAVPFTNAVLFAKVRLLDGGNFEAISSREEVSDHVARWDASFSFLCKMTASISTGILEPCICRVSVRKEAKGGKACQKLGFVDFNLAEFAGRGLTTKRFLLEGYDSRHRQDNSMLKLSIQMTLSSGDILFKVPVTPGAPGEVVETTETAQESSMGRIPSATFTDYSEGDSPTNGQLNIDDFAKHCQTVSSEAVTSPSVPESEGRTHSRNSSNHSGSGTSGFGSTTVGPGHYGSLGSQHTQHSRQSSSGDSGHMRNASNGSSGHSDIGSIDRKHHNPGSVSLERRKKEDAKESKFDATRVDPVCLVDELLRATDLQVGSNGDEGSGLQLFIGKDGSTTLGTRQPAGVYKPVIVEER